MTENNNNNFIDELREDLSGISLTTSEKQSIRTNLEESLSEPDTSTAEEPSWLYRCSRKLERFSHLLTKTAVGAAAMLFLLGGLTYAAEDALPGTPLYAIKTHVNEAFINITAVSNSKTAATQSKLAARRINELQALVDRGSLTTTTSQELLREIAAHTKSARQNIADLESANEKKRRQAAELRSQLTALLAAESETLESAATGTAVTGNGNSKLAQQAARKLVTIADQSVSTTTSRTGEKLTQSALIDLLQIAVNRLDNVYSQYQKQHDTDRTAPPTKLVAAAHDLDKALRQIQDAKYSPAVTHLQSLLVQIDDVRASFSTSSASTVAISKPSTSSTSSNWSASSTTGTTTVASNESAEQESTSTMQRASTTNLHGSSTKEVRSRTASPIPSKQNLHNQEVREIIAETKRYLEGFGKAAADEQAAQATTSDSAKRQQNQQTATSSTSASSSGSQ